MGKVEWKSGELVAKWEKIMQNRLEAAAIALQNQIKQNISIPSRTVVKSVGAKGKMKKLLGPRGSSRSLPGQFPHKDYGTLRASIARDVHPKYALVGSRLLYAKYLEFGTAKMAPRPFLLRTLREITPRIRMIMVDGVVPGKMSA